MEYNNDLIGTIPTELGLLTSLIGLYLGRNDLNGTVPSELGLIQNLTTMVLLGNQLTGNLPTTFGNLKNLGRSICVLLFHDFYNKTSHLCLCRKVQYSVPHHTRA